MLTYSRIRGRSVRWWFNPLIRRPLVHGKQMLGCYITRTDLRLLPTGSRRTTPSITNLFKPIDLVLIAKKIRERRFLRPARTKR